MGRITFGHPERLWAKEEDERLAELYWAGKTIKEIANELNRTPAAISHRHERLDILGRKRVNTEERKVKLREQIKEVSKKDPRKWTKEQIGLFYSLYPSELPIDEISHRIGKSEKAIRIQATRKSIKRPKHIWTEEGLKRQRESTSKQFKGNKIIGRKRKIPFPEEGKRNISKAILNNPKERERRSKLIREYNLTKKDYSHPWNVGKHPWDWMNITEDEFYKMIFGAQKRKPTSIEWRIIQIIEKYNLPYRYVGDGEIWICGKCPDFIHLAEKRLIEVQGDYWHTEEEAKERGDFFKKYDFITLFIWQSEMKEMTDEEIANRIRNFL